MHNILLTDSNISAISLGLDNTFKVMKKATVVEKDKTHTKIMKGGVLSVINERNEIIAWVRTLMTSLLSDPNLIHCSLALLSECFTCRGKRDATGN